MNHDLPADLGRILHLVQGPGQYAGGEINSIVKPEPEVDLRLALAFPDTYSVGMSHHGIRVLYDIVNRVPGVACERVFAPLPDMEAALREANVKLSTLETHTPLHECDMVGFSVQYELAATSILTILDLGGIPLLADEREESDPLVIAGGNVFNPEPLADFIDLFVIGDGEETLPAILQKLHAAKSRQSPRLELLNQLAGEIPGIYVPALYRTQTNPDGFTIVEKPANNAPFPIARAMTDFARAPIPVKPVIPTFQTVHERVTLEIMRGCPHGCRFCQAGFAGRPVRTRNTETLVNAAMQTYGNTGYDEIGLLSLSTSDYPDFDQLVKELDEHFAPMGVSLSLPSLRVDHALRTIPKRFKSIRKSGFTIAPEAGTDRLRAVLNKNISNTDLLAAAEAAYAQGWQTIKLYFMLGLPTETDEDVEAIAELANRIARLRRKRGRKNAVTLSVSNFVPKAHTPMQWEPMERPEELARKQQILARGINRSRVQMKPHDVRTSMLEGVLARGDRNLGRIILSAWLAGARLDSWDEHFQYEAWTRAFAEHDIDPLKYACTRRHPEPPHPWSHINLGVSPAFLQREHNRALAEERTPSCSADHCAGCGVEACDHKA